MPLKEKMTYIILNGKCVAADTARMPVDNAAFRYGFGLFETMLLRYGRLGYLAYHEERLFAGMKQLGIAIPAFLRPGYLPEQITKLAVKNGMDFARIRVQVFGGGGGIFGNREQKPGFVIECFPIGEAETELNANGLVLGISRGARKAADDVSNLKSCNAMVYAIAARHAKQNKWNDALVLNTAGNVIESAIANVFWIKEGIVYTPQLSEGCVAGVMRRYVLVKQPGIREEPLTQERLLEADEVFLTNAIKGVKWVGSIGDKYYNNHVVKTIYATIFPHEADI